MKYKFEVRGYKRVLRKPLVTSHYVIQERKGLIIRLEDEDGRVGFGEICPFEYFGTESWEEAKEFCLGFEGRVDDEIIGSIDKGRGCCRFGFESAREMMIRGGEGEREFREFEVAGLIGLEDGIKEVMLKGYRTLKCKIGRWDFDREKKSFLRLRERLPEGVKLRLDANGGLTRKLAEEWLKFLEAGKYNVEFLEQPLKKGEEAVMRELGRDYRTGIALDESVARVEDLKKILESGWLGWIVVKPVFMGDLEEFRKLRNEYVVPIVYSSVFETGIGGEAVLRIAGEDKRNKHAVGFGTTDYFYEDGFNLGGVGKKGAIVRCGRSQIGDLERIWELCFF